MNCFETLFATCKHFHNHFRLSLRRNLPNHCRFRRFTPLITISAPSTRAIPIFGTLRVLSLASSRDFSQRYAHSERVQASTVLADKAEMATTTAADCIPESALSETVSMSGEEDVIEDTPTNGLHYSGSPFDLEKHYDYEAGGHHPVHLGDTFGNGRYRVIHKLGSGGTGNVWLCRDLHAGTPTYVALKILMAEVSTADCPELVQGKLLKGYENSDGAEAICHFLDLFNLDGPNGTHFCFVYPLLGPKVSRGQIRTSADPDKTLREMCRVTVQALAFLHSKSICHGGLSTYSWG